jgi:hypothetical protein
MVIICVSNTNGSSTIQEKVCLIYILYMLKLNIFIFYLDNKKIFNVLFKHNEKIKVLEIIFKILKNFPNN